jgi:hypothetical protein
MDLVSILTILLPTTVGGFSAFWGIHVYRDAQKLKRKDILFPLVEALHKSKSMRDAELILDDRIIRYEKSWNKAVNSYNIVWDEILGDYGPLKHFMLEEMGLAWTENLAFAKSEDKSSVYIHDKDHFLSIINDEKLPYCVDVATLDKLIVLKGDKSIMIEREDQIRRSFDSLFSFFEGIGYLDSNLRLFRNEERNFFLERAKKLLDDDSIKDYINYYGFRLIV